MGSRDPPRTGVQGAIAKCREADPASGGVWETLDDGTDSDGDVFKDDGEGEEDVHLVEHT